jgi:hypothetical protein
MPVQEKSGSSEGFRELKEQSKQRWVLPFNIAIIYAGLNDKDQAFKWIDKSIEACGLLALAKVEIRRKSAP